MYVLEVFESGFEEIGRVLKGRVLCAYSANSPLLHDNLATTSSA
jgi:hypothetical protein